MAYPGAAYRPTPQQQPQPQIHATYAAADPSAPPPGVPPPAYNAQPQVGQPVAYAAQPVGFAPQQQQQFYQQPGQPVAGPYAGQQQQFYQQPVPSQNPYGQQQVYYQGQPGYGQQQVYGQQQGYPPQKQQQQEVGTGTALAGGCCAACLACQCLGCLGEILSGGFE